MLMASCVSFDDESRRPQAALLSGPSSTRRMIVISSSQKQYFVDSTVQFLFGSLSARIALLDVTEDIPDVLARVGQVRGPCSFLVRMLARTSCYRRAVFKEGEKSSMAS